MTGTMYRIVGLIFRFIRLLDVYLVCLPLTPCFPGTCEGIAKWNPGRFALAMHPAGEPVSSCSRQRMGCMVITFISPRNQRSVRVPTNCANSCRKRIRKHVSGCRLLPSSWKSDTIISMREVPVERPGRRRQRSRASQAGGATYTKFKVIEATHDSIRVNDAPHLLGRHTPAIPDKHQR